MKLWLLRRPNKAEPYKPDQGYVIRANTENEAREIAGGWPNECMELTAEGSPGVVLKNV